MHQDVLIGTTMVTIPSVFCASSVDLVVNASTEITKVVASKYSYLLTSTQFFINPRSRSLVPFEELIINKPFYDKYVSKFIKQDYEIRTRFTKDIIDLCFFIATNPTQQLPIQDKQMLIHIGMLFHMYNDTSYNIVTLHTIIKQVEYTRWEVVYNESLNYMVNRNPQITNVQALRKIVETNYTI